MNFDIEQLEKNKVEEGQKKTFFISTFGCQCVKFNHLLSNQYVERRCIKGGKQII